MRRSVKGPPAQSGPGGRAFYRVVVNNPPTEADFRSKAELGAPMPSAVSEGIRHLWDGISVFATRAQAARVARRFPLLGAFIARLSIDDQSGIRFERTTATPGHYTLWGNAQQLVACVIDVNEV